MKRKEECKHHEIQIKIKDKNKLKKSKEVKCFLKCPQILGREKSMEATTSKEHR